MANVFGRDCINFSALYYHGVPYMCGFDGKDYTNLKTLVNHQWQGLGTVQRMATANDIEYKWILSDGDLSKSPTLAGVLDTAGVGDWFWKGGGFLLDGIAGMNWGKDK